MLRLKENERITQVGPGTPMGELMRRYWTPALLSWEVPEPDCPPVRVRLLSEDLVAFRDTNGKIGLLDAHCAHRRANLFFGRNEECGLRCVYHGWKYDADGNCVDMPSEPEESNFKHKVHLTAYPTVEMGGVIWAYMGPPDKRPAEPKFGWTQAPETHRSVTKVQQECNWLQGLEGGIDTVHSSYLHLKFAGTASEVRDRARARSGAVRVEVKPTDYGYTYGGIRVLNEEENYVRAYHYVMPYHQMRSNQFTRQGTKVAGHIWVPVDDENTMVWNWLHSFGEEPLTEEELLQRGTGNEIGRDVDPTTFRSYQNKDNDYLIDREMQKNETFTGITGQNTQDRAVQDSMGPICDRTREHLGTTDGAIVAARRMLLQAMETVEDGGDPPAVGPIYYTLRATEGVLPKSALWHEAMADELFGGDLRD